jgi:hypothetical protein
MPSDFLDIFELFVKINGRHYNGSSSCWLAAFLWRSSALTTRGRLSTPISNVHNNPRNKKKGEEKKNKKNTKRCYKILQTFTVESELREPMLIR